MRINNRKLLYDKFRDSGYRRQFEQLFDYYEELINRVDSILTDSFGEVLIFENFMKDTEGMPLDQLHEYCNEMLDAFQYIIKNKNGGNINDQ